MNKRYIKAQERYSTIENQVPAPLFRRSFKVDGALKSATLSISGMGFYILYINGKDITKGHLAPYISNPDHICYYDTYDLSEALTEGENVIGVILGNGMLNCPGGRIWDFDDAPYRSAPMLAVELDYADASGEHTVVADGEFKTHPSAILFDDLRLGETYDARLEIEGWSEAGFDDSDWTSAIDATAPRGKLKRVDAEPIRAYKTLHPVSVTREGDAYLYDFGINSAGKICMNIDAAEGQKITLWHGELLHEGKFYNHNICFFRPGYEYYLDYNQTLRYTCREGKQSYEPHFHYSGFRYVLVEGITEEQATKELLTYRLMSSELPTIGGFKCSDDRLNKLFSMVKNSDRSNFFYFPTDCPHREKNGWMGDASLSADHTALLFDVERSYREWLNNIRLAQNERGELPGIVPTAGWGYEWGNGPTWDSALFNLPYVLYKYRGCLEVVHENVHSQMRYLQYVMTRRSPDGTVAIGLGDWEPVDRAPDEYIPPLALTDSIMVMDMARKAAEMFSAAGYKAEAVYAEAVYEEMRAAIRRELLNKDTLTVAGECQSAQAIALYYGVFDESEKRAAFEKLLEFIHAEDDAFSGGFIALHCLFCLLSENGEAELAYKLITREQYPSYTWLIDNGFTSMPEHFIREEPRVDSVNHHFFGDISRWMMVYLAGLKIVDSRTVEISPCAVREIDYAEAYYDLPLGRVSARWSRDENGKVSVDWTAPVGVRVIAEEDCARFD